MDFVQEASELKNLQAKSQKLIYAVQIKSNDLERALKKAFDISWKQKFPEHNCYALASCYSDFVGIYLYSVKKSFEDIHLFEDGWAQIDKQDDPHYGLPTDGPFPFSELISKIKEIEEENPGMKIKFATLNRRSTVEEVTSFRSIQMLHPDSEVKLLSQGKKWYIGWDIPDYYIRVEIDGQEWVWWSDDAHGGTLTCSAKKGTPEFERFEAWLKSE